jgi:titin
LLSDKPTSPQNLRVTDIQIDHAMLKWEAPEADGGSPVTSYIIEKRDTNKTSWFTAGNVDGSTLTYKVSKLFEGSDYLFRVSAENKIGVSDPTDTKEPVTAKLPYGPPGAPRKVQVQDITTKACTLTWKAPEFDGGAEITGYYVERQQAFSTRWTKVNKKSIKSTKLDVTDLVELTEYMFRVVAENEAGPGKPSEATGVVVAKDPFSKPAAPGAPIIEETTKDTASLSWTAPRDDGNSPITHYVVEMKQVGDLTWKVANLTDKVTRPKFVVSSLKEGAQYEFRVAAVNKVGQGPASESTSSSKYEESIFFVRNLEDKKTSRIPDTITFVCEINNPSYKVEWYKGDRQIKINEKYELCPEGAVHTLIIKDVDGKDAGKYSARCKNRTTEATLTVEGKANLLCNNQI